MQGINQFRVKTQFQILTMQDIRAVVHVNLGQDLDSEAGPARNSPVKASNTRRDAKYYPSNLSASKGFPYHLKSPTSIRIFAAPLGSQPFSRVASKAVPSSASAPSASAAGRVKRQAWAQVISRLTDMGRRSGAGQDRRQGVGALKTLSTDIEEGVLFPLIPARVVFICSPLFIKPDPFKIYSGFYRVSSSLKLMM
jgi:hypothetical protein